MRRPVPFGAALGVPPRPPAAPPRKLTPRQAEFTFLLWYGYDPAEAGARLGAAPRTIQRWCDLIETLNPAAYKHPDQARITAAQAAVALRKLRLFSDDGPPRDPPSRNGLPVHDYSGAGRVAS